MVKHADAARRVHQSVVAMASVTTGDIKKNASAKLMALVNNKRHELEDHALLAPCIHATQHGETSSQPDDLAAAEHRCASPEPLPVLPGLEEDFEQACPEPPSALSVHPVGAEESGEEEELAVDPALSDSSSEGFVER